MRDIIGTALNAAIPVAMIEVGWWTLVNGYRGPFLLGGLTLAVSGALWIFEDWTTAKR